MVQRKYGKLFGSRAGLRRPGPPGPSRQLIQLVVEMKGRNPRFGCPRIANQLARAFGIEVDKDLVRRVLAKHYRPDPRGDGPSWLARLGNGADQLWSVDLFCCESILLKTHWVMVVMDQFSRRIVGFGVQAIAVDGAALCRMFNQAIAGIGIPRRISIDHAPVFRFHRWSANLRIQGVQQIRSVPFVPVSHPFVERLIGTIRREFLDHVLFWSDQDLNRKLTTFANYYNWRRTHAGLNGRTPAEAAGAPAPLQVDPGDYAWQSFCGDLFQLPAVA